MKDEQQSIQTSSRVKKKENLKQIALIQGSNFGYCV